ncbi:ABC transporter permease [Falsarthrobacter nasiphocae]|uniref:Oligopeptide transport system permease protein OppC n=1 Tax=Falsarthrobacter nasiphocae TaxID=189863 RepID=A0AAE3YIB9_9MICC|nr:ABC transporter permease [Falsarthrobacter nasiphocae]MDR6892468.1 peptide/nickel transport system permease protein [Falsarthrobacter nasiphocae]
MSTASHPTDAHEPAPTPESAAAATPSALAGAHAAAPEGTASAPQDEGRIYGKKTIIARRFFRNIPATIGLVVLTLVALFAAFGQFLTPWKHDDLDFLNTATGPSAEHWLGTNLAGADMMALLIQGTRISLTIGVVVGISSALIAGVYGCFIALSTGKWIEKVFMIFLEFMILLPSFLIIAVLTNGKGGSWGVLMVMLIVFGWMGGARLVRALAGSLIDREFVKGARYMGMSTFGIIRRHLVPNIASQMVLSITTGIWASILSEVGFSYLGLGVKVPDTSLGLLISQASEAFHSYPWMFWEPVLMLLLITGPLALINDGLRDAFDPTSKASGKAKKSA